MWSFLLFPSLVRAAKRRGFSHLGVVIGEAKKEDRTGQTGMDGWANMPETE